MEDPKRYAADIENIGSPREEEEEEDRSIHPSPSAPQIGTDGTQVSPGSGHSPSSPIERDVHQDPPKHLPN